MTEEARSMKTLFATLETRLRTSFADNDPTWVDDAIAAAATVPHSDDPDEYLRSVITAAMQVIQARIATMEANTAARNRATDATEAIERTYRLLMEAPNRGGRH